MQPTSGTDVVPTFNSVRAELLIRRSRLSGKSLARREIDATMSRKTIKRLVLIAEASLAAYLALVAWLLSAWAVDDSQGFRMTTADWYIEAARRLGLAVVVGAVFGGVTYLANRWWATPLFSDSPRGGTRAAILLASCIVLAGPAGAVRFAVRKPFM